jgi:hypothetical protein
LLHIGDAWVTNGKEEKESMDWNSEGAIAADLTNLHLPQINTTISENCLVCKKPVFNEHHLAIFEHRGQKCVMPVVFLSWISRFLPISEQLNLER